MFKDLGWYWTGYLSGALVFQLSDVTRWTSVNFFAVALFLAPAAIALLVFGLPVLFGRLADLRDDVRSFRRWKRRGGIE